MDVRGIINMISSLSVGLDEPTQADVSVYLSYLNQVHLKLYRQTAPNNPFLVLGREILPVVDGIVSPTSEPFFMLRSIYTEQGTPLTASSLDNILKEDPRLTRRATPTQWYFSSNAISVYPLFTGNVGVLYVKNPTLFNINTTEEQIPYPAAYHDVLVNGTLFYLFSQEAGFRTDGKMAEVKQLWEQQSQELLTYLIKISGKKLYSTYSVV
jgi:hypothetical protein